MVTVSGLGHLGFSEEKEIRISRRKAVFNKLNVRFKAANVAEVKCRNDLMKVSRQFSFKPKEHFGTFLVSQPDKNFKADFFSTHFNFEC